MSLLFRIIYAAHANGTHHKLALDALDALKGTDREAWMRLFLKHVARYMEGAKAPDTTFKDFKNHVLHVGENYWGGAPEATTQWFDKTVAALKAQNWDEAIYAAGVMGHYYTDPIMPFHTGQTEAENAIHRAAEWSINRSYYDLRQLAETKLPPARVAMPSGADWLRQMVCNGAETSHAYYEKLIAHYDIHRGVANPPAGLDGVARGIAAELLMYASSGLALILERALAEAKVAPPHVELTRDTVMAAIRIPAKTLAKRLTNAEDRAVVQAMYSELTTTGRVDKTLPADDRMVRDLHAVEVLAPKQKAQAAARAARFTAAEPGVPAAPAIAVKMPTLAPVASSAATLRPVVPAPPIHAALTQPEPRPEAAAAAHAMAAASQFAGVLPRPATSVPSIAAAPAATAPDRRDRGLRVYLTGSEPLEAAPSIGPKLAERFLPLGIKTVAEFLTSDPAKLAARLADRRINDTLLDEWQCQARLVMEVAGLRGTHAQLLTGAGYRTTGAIAAADQVKLAADVLRFGASPEGRRVLRDGEPPDVEKIKGWVDLARSALAA